MPNDPQTRTSGVAGVTHDRRRARRPGASPVTVSSRPRVPRLRIWVVDPPSDEDPPPAAPAAALRPVPSSPSGCIGRRVDTSLREQAALELRARCEFVTVDYGSDGSVLGRHCTCDDYRLDLQRIHLWEASVALASLAGASA